MACQNPKIDLEVPIHRMDIKIGIGRAKSVPVQFDFSFGPGKDTIFVNTLNNGVSYSNKSEFIISGTLFHLNNECYFNKSPIIKTSV